MSKSTEDDGTGCIVWMAVIAFAIDAGCLWGAGVGWFAFGSALLLLLLVSA